MPRMLGRLQITMLCSKHPVAKLNLEHPVKARSRRSKPWWMKVVFCGAWRAWSKKTIWAIVVLIPIIRLTVNKFWMLLMKYGCHIPFPSAPASRQRTRPSKSLYRAAVDTPLPPFIDAAEKYKERISCLLAFRGSQTFISVWWGAHWDMSLYLLTFY